MSETTTERHPFLEQQPDSRDLQHGPEWGDTAYICSNCADRPWNVGDDRAGVRFCGCSIWQNAEWSGWRSHIIRLRDALEQAKQART